MLPPGVNAPGTAAPGEVLAPKKQAVVDRLRRRIESYRRRQTDFMPRFGQSFNGFCEQNIQETLLLKQKFLENKSKRAAKKQEKKQPEQVTNLIAQQKFLKRSAEEDGAEFGESGTKMPCGAGAGNGGGSQGAAAGSGGASRPAEGLTKFSVEIVQQLEFTTSAANSQPQQISTNVTVKALTNASVKSSTMEEPARPAPAQPPPPSPVPLVECKQEPDSEFVDLEQCAAALEKDAQNNNSFPGLSELIGNEGSDEIITSDAFKDLISEISDFPSEFMKDFDFGENNCMMKVEVDSKEGIVPQHNYQQQYEKTRIPPYTGLEFGKGEMSPAAQTLKQMAEQHQHKTQLGMGFPTGRPSRSPYTDYQFSQGEFKNQSTNTSQPEVKQEVNFSASQSQSFQAGIRSPGGPKTPTNMMGGYKQQYSPYSSPGGHSSPGYMPRGQGPGGPGPGPSPSRPPSASNGPTLQMSQSQQMHINQQSPGPQIQVSAGQHMQLNSEMKNVGSIAAQQQQGVYFAQSGSENSYNMSQSQTINFTQQSLRQRGPSEQMLRTGLRPPPPDYKPSPQNQQQQAPLMHSMGQPRFPQSAVRRPGPGQQPMPPSGPMMRPQMPPGGQVYMGGGMPRGMPPGATGYLQRHRAPNVLGADGMTMPGGRGPEGMPMGPGRVPDGMSMNSGMGMGRGPETMGMGRVPDMSMGPGRVPDGMSMGMGPGRGPDTMAGRTEWRHVMSQQQAASYGRTFQNHPGNFQMSNNPPGMQQMHPQLRNQMMMSSPMMQNHVSQSNPMSMSLQMSQSQSMSVGGSMNMSNSHNSHNSHGGNALQFHHMHNNSFPNLQSSGDGSHAHSQAQMSNGMGSNSLQGNTAGDIGLEFLDNLSGDTQDLFGSLDSPTNFNINDIL